MGLDDLDVYLIARQLSRAYWEVYIEMDSHIRFNTGSQALRSIDSIGANIAEGYGRYHYLDSVKFYYNARGSLWESVHWIELLYERGLLEEQIYTKLRSDLNLLVKKLNSFINSIKNKKENLKN